MSKELRKVEMQNLADKVDKVLRLNLIDIEDQLDQIPEDVFSEPFNADFEDSETNNVKTEIIRLANELVNGTTSEDTDEQPFILDYSGLGVSNVALQAQNFLAQLETEQVQFLTKCASNMKEIDQSNAVLERTIAAMEIRLQSGDDMGEMGRLKEMTLEEQRSLFQHIKDLDTELQESLIGVINKVFGADKDQAAAVISELCMKVLSGSGDPYIEVNADDRKIIPVLKTIGLVSSHPHNPSKVRLINMD